MDLEALIQTITDYPYLGAAAVFLLCGLGFPIPEELVLLAAGFVCAKFPEEAQLLPMMGWCAGAIVVGDMIPFALGKVFGVRLLKLRWLRFLITKQRLATFDHWFRRRGDLVIVISRFIPGLRVVAFFTAGAMKMRSTRFLLLDGLGIALIVPLLTWAGFRSAGFIEEAFETVQRVERGLLWAVVGVALALAAWLWIWKRRRSQQRRDALTEAFVQPKTPVQGSPSEPEAPLPGALVRPDAEGHGDDQPRSEPRSGGAPADGEDDTEPPDPV